MRAASIQARTAIAGPRASRRLLALAGDERLVEQIRRGNEAAFEVAFERHGPSILGFCRHMLGSPDEAEDAVQHTFAAAHRDLLRDSDREITLKPWLFTIARNRCVSMLRGRREQPLDDTEVHTAGLAEQVEQRAELRELLADLGELPDEQRAALLLAEISDLSHSEVARVLGCEVPRVKALVFRARSGLIQRRDARETSCESIQEQLATLRGGSLRRTELRLHLRGCAACRAYRDQVKRQRQLLAAALPVAPSVALKSSVLAAVGVGGGSAGGGIAAGLASVAGALTGATGSGVLAKVAIVGVLVGGGAVAGEAVLDSRQNPHSAPTPATERPAEGGSVEGDRAAASALLKERTSGREHHAQAIRKENQRIRPRGRVPATNTGLPPGQAKQSRGRALAYGQQGGKSQASRGKARGPIDAPPASTPVRRGPPEPKTKPEPTPRAAHPPGAKPTSKVPPEAAAQRSPADTPAPETHPPDIKPNGKPKP
jgi:RNA polymerase sigma factor (sigma-70 family)